MLRHCNSIMVWLGRELGWDLLSEKNQIGSKKPQMHLFLSLDLGISSPKKFSRSHNGQNSLLSHSITFTK